MTLAFILLYFTTNLAWIFSYKDLKDENKKLEQYEKERWDYYFRGVEDEKEIIKDNFEKAQTQEEFCNWVYNSFLNNVEKVEND